MATKKTVIEMFEEIKSVPGLTDEQIAFLEKRIELTAKKNAKNTENAKPTKTQLENEEIKAVILDTLTATPTTISDLMKANEVLSSHSNQKISALLTQLFKSGTVVRAYEKGKPFYYLPTNTEV